ALQLDPYLVAPLWPDAVSLAALQARMLLDSERVAETDMAEVVARSRRNALANPNAQLRKETTVEALLTEPYLVSPLRRHDCPPISDGAAVVVLAAGERANRITARPAWISGIDHRIEVHALGARDLMASPSTALAAKSAGVFEGHVDVAELHAPFSHQELILRDALQLDGDTAINPSGGALASNPMMGPGRGRGGQPDDGGGADPHRRGGPASDGWRCPPGGGPRDVGSVLAAEPGVRPRGFRLPSSRRGRQWLNAAR